MKGVINTSVDIYQFEAGTKKKKGKKIYCIFF